MMVRRRYPIKKKKKDGEIEEEARSIHPRKKEEEEEEEYGIERLKSMQACCLIWMAWLERERGIPAAVGRERQQPSPWLWM